MWTLEGKQSPWKDRVAGRWKRRLVTTDSSAEQSLEVGCFVRFRRAPTPAHFGGCRRNATENPRLRSRAPGGSLRAASRDSSRATRRGKASSYGGFDCPRRRRRFGTGARRAISRDNDGSFGPRPRCVLDDVGVRFGGSEHHRIDTSSSHTRPPARKGRDSQPPRGRATGAIYSIARLVPGIGQPLLFGASRARFHPGHHLTSSEARWGSTGVRQTELFGAPRAAPRRSTKASTLRGVGRRSPLGQGPGALRSLGRPSQPG
jgi:hypothetical protein